MKCLIIIFVFLSDYGFSFTVKDSTFYNQNFKIIKTSSDTGYHEVYKYYTLQGKLHKIESFSSESFMPITTILDSNGCIIVESRLIQNQGFIKIKCYSYFKSGNTKEIKEYLQLGLDTISVLDAETGVYYPTVFYNVLEENCCNGSLIPAGEWFEFDDKHNIVRQSKVPKRHIIEK